MDTPRSVRKTVSEVSRRLGAVVGLDDPQYEASLLVAHVLGTNRGRLPLHFEGLLSDLQARDLAMLVERRTRHEPLQYLLGSWPFLDLELTVQAGTLIPRPETGDFLEALFPMVQDHFAETPFVFLDVGTGSGAIGLALLHRFPNATGILTDLSAPALAIARANVHAHPEMTARATLVQGNLLHCFRRACCDLVISNPPYIPHGDLPELMSEVRDFEPHLALDGGEDGLDVIRYLLDAGATHLRPRGLLAFEHGWDQRQSILALPAPGLQIQFLGNDRGERNRFLLWQKS